MPKGARLLGVLHFRVRKGGFTAGAPIDNAVPLINQPFVIQSDKHLAHRSGAFFVHGKRLPRPVARRAHFALLEGNAAPVLRRPIPGALQKAFPADVRLRKPLFLHLFDDLHLGGDGRMVIARDPERGISLHSLKTDEGILHGGVHGVSHVQLSRDVGRRHHDGEGNLVVVDLRAEIAGFFPIGINSVFEILGVVRLLHVHNL